MAGVDLDLNFRKVLVVSDMSPESAAATRYARLLGHDLGLEIEMISVSADDAEPDLPKVTERARACADGLLILGVRDESAWKRHLHASFAFELIAKTTCPVLSVHQQ